MFSLCNKVEGSAGFEPAVIPSQVGSASKEERKSSQKKVGDRQDKIHQEHGNVNILPEDDDDGHGKCKGINQAEAKAAVL
ncbi:hypothetical protein GcM1_236075 [Golovinomyces cichoracearum]|uniref:Uncharacterized protein n=1 Tax=Golovinomyces cichoracearum TaxID=62708 RepID=A0A420IKH1_9PEZI|nr:hypothetical protein GcM1_236075 [Golovinomyces cichoracearum]